MGLGVSMLASLVVDDWGFLMGGRVVMRLGSFVLLFVSFLWEALCLIWLLIWLLYVSDGVLGMY